MNQYINKNAINTVQFMTSIKVLYVSEPGFLHQGVFQNKLIQAERANVGTASPSLERLKYYNST
jgi:hypothetical protein